MIELTVGKLRDALIDVPDNLKVVLESDTGLTDVEGEVVIEGACRVMSLCPQPRERGESCYKKIDYFGIYANELLPVR